MKILHIITENKSELARKLIEFQSKSHEVKIIELSQKDVSYESIINEIFAHDRVIPW
jgi:hypothetical protein